MKNVLGHRFGEPLDRVSSAPPQAQPDPQTSPVHESSNRQCSCGFHAYMKLDNTFTVRAMCTATVRKTLHEVAGRDRVHISTCVFFLTIFFNHSIQLSNCDELMSQCSITNGRENRNHGNQEEGEESCQEEEIAAFRVNEGTRKRPLRFWSGCGAASAPVLTPPAHSLRSRPQNASTSCAGQMPR
jgi:hypothetical protein